MASLIILDKSCKKVTFVTGEVKEMEKGEIEEKLKEATATKESLTERQERSAQKRLYEAETAYAEEVSQLDQNYLKREAEIKASYKASVEEAERIKEEGLKGLLEEKELYLSKAKEKLESVRTSVAEERIILAEATETEQTMAALSEQLETAAKEEEAKRQAEEILQKAGVSTTPVQPVKKIGISF